MARQKFGLVDREPVRYPNKLRTVNRMRSTSLEHVRQQLAAAQVATARHGTFAGIAGGLAELLPEPALTYGVIHEVLHKPGASKPWFVASLLAQAATADGRMIVWCDAKREIYPPALVQAGIGLDRLVFLRSRNGADEVWAVAECLRCRGIGAVVSAPPRLSRVEARRLQLAAERGGGVGLLVRSAGQESGHYAAATRWFVEPAPGDAAVRRWRVQLVHGHGGRLGESVLVEMCRDTNRVRGTHFLADRSTASKATRVTA